MHKHGRYPSDMSDSKCAETTLFVPSATIYCYCCWYRYWWGGVGARKILSHVNEKSVYALAAAGSIITAACFPCPTAEKSSRYARGAAVAPTTELLPA